MNTASRFVGRNEERGELRRRLQTPAESESFVLGSGEAGVGKTRLVDRVLQATGVAGHSTLAPSFWNSGHPSKPPFRSPRAIGMHVSNTLMKFACRSRTELDHGSRAVPRNRGIRPRNGR